MKACGKPGSRSPPGHDCDRIPSSDHDVDTSKEILRIPGDRSWRETPLGTFTAWDRHRVARPFPEDEDHDYGRLAQESHHGGSVQAHDDDLRRDRVPVLHRRGPQAAGPVGAP